MAKAIQSPEFASRASFLPSIHCFLMVRMGMAMMIRMAMMMTRILPLVLLPIHPLFSPVHSIREHPWQMWRCSVKIDGFYITQFCRSFFSSTDSSYLVNCIFSLFPLHHTFGYESEKKKVWQVWRKVAVLTLLPCDRFSRSRNEGASLCRKYVGMLIPSTRLSFFSQRKGNC